MSLLTFLLQITSPKGGNASDFPSLTILAVVFIITVFFTWFFIHRSKEKERLLLIEKGFDPSELPEKELFGFNFKFPWLKVGVVITSGSVGLMIGVILDNIKSSRLEGTPLIGMLIFGGIGMIIAHYLDVPKDKS
jgi:hypothetical protein